MGANKLTEDQRRAVSMDPRNLRAIAADYSVSHVAVWKIKRRPDAPLPRLYRKYRADQDARFYDGAEPRASR